ncbi:hypothetical protein P692DRAFT_20508645 [Suillus brevipes Sb2]|nr:hypothetical protein P692DRAFT_20508645 [Suillus brevipes Sb2]
MNTLCRLLLLVNKCPLLKSAHLAINTNVMEGIEGRPASMVSANGFQYLVLADATVENSRVIAFIISSVPEENMARVILAR